MMASRLPAHLYVHVPFCRAKCRYCDFHSEVGSAEAQLDWIEAIGLELEALGRRPRPRTVYVGGGTPTALPPRVLASFLDVLGRHAVLDRVEEFTVEANPGTLTTRAVDLFLDHGVNRFSVGVQTLDDRLLRLLGRVHDAETARASLRMLRAAGVENLSVDLIFGIPGSTPHGWRRDLDEVLELEPEHVSVYGLTIEEGTVFDRWRRDGRLRSLDEDELADRYEAAEATLVAAGYEHYEISSYARPGFRGLHNGATWRNAPYLGLGPAAASFRDGERTRNVASTGEYVRRLRAGRSPVDERERLDPRRSAGETMMLALRTADGITAGEVLRRHGVDPLKRWRRPIERFRRAGLLDVKRRRIRLTPEGWLLADEVLSTFVSPPRR